MYRLRDLKNGQYQIHKKNGMAYEGTKDGIAHAAVKLGVDEKELGFAFEELEKRGHTVAEFGVYGKLIFTDRDQKK